MVVKIWSLALRMRVLENKVLRNAFEPKRDEVTGNWRRPQNEELRVTK
jgi:hypothetical protein